MAPYAVEYVHHAAPERDLDLLPLGRGGQGIGDVGVVAAVQGAEDGLGRGHPPVDLALVAGGRVHDHLARRLVGARQGAAQHHRRGAAGQGQEYVLVLADAAVGDDGHVVAHRAPGLPHRLELGHPRRGLQPGAAAPTGADPHLHRVGADVAQKGGGLGGAGVAAHHRHVGEAVAQLLHGPLHHLGVAVGDVDDQHVGPGFDQGLGPVQEVAPGADGGPDPQPALGVLADVGPAAVQDDVLFGDEAADPAPVVHQRQLLDAVLVEDPLGLVEGHVGGAGLEPLDWGHGLGHGPLGVVGEPGDVAGRQEPHQHPAAGGVLDEHAGVVLADDLSGLPQGGAAGHGEGLLHHVAVAALDPAHLVGLGLDGHAPVHEPDAALQGHRLGHGPVGDAVHVGRADGQLQVDVGGEGRGQAHVAPRLGDALAGPHQEVVEGLAHEAGLDSSGHWVQGLEVAERRLPDGTGSPRHPAEAAGRLRRSAPRRE